MTRNYIANIYKVLHISNWESIDIASGNKLIFFYHYTPLMPVLFTVSSLIFGLSEFSLRIVTVILSLFMLFYIYEIGCKLYSRETGILAAVFTLITPMFLYFGKLPDHEPILTAFCVVTFYQYLNIDIKKNKNSLFFFILLILSLLESWGGFFFLFFLILHAFIIRKSKTSFIFLLILSGISVIVFQIILIYLFHGKESISDLLRYGILRMNMDTSTQNIVRFSFKQFAVTEIRYTVIYFTKVLCGLSLLWLIKLMLQIFGKVRSKSILSDKLMLILFFYGAFFVLIFRNLAYIHDYKLYLLLPFIAISSARMIEIIFNKISRMIKNNNIRNNWIVIKKIFLIITVIAVTFERLTYLKTLLSSSFDKPGYDLGIIIRKKTKDSDKILINSEEFDSFYNVFIRFYANRNIIAKDLTLFEFNKNIETYKNYRYIVIINNRPADSKLTEYLINNYSSEKTGDYRLVDIKKELIKGK